MNSKKKNNQLAIIGSLIIIAITICLFGYTWINWFGGFDTFKLLIEAAIYAGYISTFTGIVYLFFFLAGLAITFYFFTTLTKFIFFPEQTEEDKEKENKKRVNAKIKRYENKIKRLKNEQ